MRKIMSTMLLVLIAAFLTGCSHTDTQKAYELLIERGEPSLNLSPVYVYAEDELYSVVIIEDGNIIKAVQFSQNRSYSNVIDVRLQPIENIKGYLGKSIDDIEDILGEYHTNIGSGLYMPSYITNDGYLVSFTIDDGIVQHVGKTDLLSGESVEWYCLNTDVSST